MAKIGNTGPVPFNDVQDTAGVAIGYRQSIDEDPIRKLAAARTGKQTKKNKRSIIWFDDFYGGGSIPSPAPPPFCKLNTVCPSNNGCVTVSIGGGGYQVVCTDEWYEDENGNWTHFNGNDTLQTIKKCGDAIYLICPSDGSADGLYVKYYNGYNHATNNISWTGYYCYNVLAKDKCGKRETRSCENGYIVIRQYRNDGVKIGSDIITTSPCNDSWCDGTTYILVDGNGVQTSIENSEYCTVKGSCDPVQRCLSSGDGYYDYYTKDRSGLCVFDHSGPLISGICGEWTCSDPTCDGISTDGFSICTNNKTGQTQNRKYSGACDCGGGVVKTNDGKCQWTDDPNSGTTDGHFSALWCDNYGNSCFYPNPMDKFPVSKCTPTESCKKCEPFIRSSTVGGCEELDCMTGVWNKVACPPNPPDWCARGTKIVTLTGYGAWCWTGYSGWLGGHYDYGQVEGMVTTMSGVGSTPPYSQPAGWSYQGWSDSGGSYWNNGVVKSTEKTISKQVPISMDPSKSTITTTGPSNGVQSRCRYIYKTSGCGSWRCWEAGDVANDFPCQSAGSEDAFYAVQQYYMSIWATYSSPGGQYSVWNKVYEYSPWRGSYSGLPKCVGKGHTYYITDLYMTVVSDIDTPQSGFLTWHERFTGLPINEFIAKYRNWQSEVV